MRGVKKLTSAEPLKFRVPVALTNRKYAPIEFDRYSYFKHHQSMGRRGAPLAEALLPMDERDRVLSDKYAQLLSDTQQLLVFMQLQKPLKSHQLQSLRRQIGKHGFRLEMLNGRLFKGQLLCQLDSIKASPVSDNTRRLGDRHELLGMFNLLEGCGGMFILYPQKHDIGAGDDDIKCVGEQLRQFIAIQQQPSLSQSMLTMGARLERNLFGPAELIDYSRRIDSRQMIMGSLLGVIGHPASQLAGMFSHWPQQLSMSLEQYIKQQQEESDDKSDK